MGYDFGDVVEFVVVCVCEVVGIDLVYGGLMLLCGGFVVFVGFGEK